MLLPQIMPTLIFEFCKVLKGLIILRLFSFLKCQYIYMYVYIEKSKK